MYATNYFENQILNLARGTSITAPVDVYLALWIGSPTDTGTGGQEVSYTDYARKKIVFSAPSVVSSGVQITNSAEITFNRATANAGTVTHIAIMDAATGGNMILYGQLVDTLSIVSGVSPLIQAGAIAYILTGSISSTWKTNILNTLRGTNASGFTAYMALFNGDPQGSGNEFSGSNYSRKAVTFSAPTQLETGPAQILNSSAVYTDKSTGNWGTWSHTALMDAQSSGNVFCSNARNNSTSMALGYSGGYDANGISVTVN